MENLDAISSKQLDFIRNSDARVNLASGAIRAGKTIIGLVAWLFFIPIAPPGGILVMAGRTRDSVWRNCIIPLQDRSLFGPLAKHVVGNFGAPTVKILGRTVYVFGAPDSKASDSLQGATVSGAFVDEATTIHETFFTQLLGRMSPPGARMFASTNPNGPGHWLKTKFLDRVGVDLDNWKHWHFTIDDNPSLTDEYKNSIKTEYTGVWYDRFIKGLWIAGEGAIFSMFNTNTHVIPWEDTPPMERIMSVGVDYGTTNPTAAVVLGQARNGDLYALNEWSYSGKETNTPLTDGQLANRMEQFLATQHAPDDTRRPDVFILDPSAASFRVELSMRGQPVMNADNDVSYGIQAIASQLGDNQLFITDRCARLIEELPTYAWDDKAAARGEDKPLQINDHAIDALRYALVTTETHWRHRQLERKVAA